MGVGVSVFSTRGVAAEAGLDEDGADEVGAVEPVVALGPDGVGVGESPGLQLTRTVPSRASAASSRIPLPYAAGG